MANNKDKPPKQLSIEKIAMLWLCSVERDTWRNRGSEGSLPQQHFIEMKAFFEKYNAPSHTLEWLDNKIALATPYVEPEAQGEGAQSVREMIQGLKDR